jgi:hypothetical protein
MVVRRVATYEYKNDYLYLVVRQAPEYGDRSYLFCCGIDIMKFNPLCRGKSGICSNPAFKGLQLLRADVSAFVRKQGAFSRPLHMGECMSISPRGENWYRESMVLDNVTPRLARQTLAYGVRDLLVKVLTVGAPGVKVPKTLPNPPQLQVWIRSLEKG